MTDDLLLNSAPIKIDGDRHLTICEALLDGYRTHSQLKMMVSHRVNENLNAIAGGQNLEEVTFNLVDWADRTGKISELILGAWSHNRDNEMLRSLVVMYRTWQGKGANLNYDSSLNDAADLITVGDKDSQPSVNIDENTINPFYVGGAVPSQLFCGRQEILGSIIGRLCGVGAQSVSIVGERRIGKSSILRYVSENYRTLFPANRKYLVIYVDLMKARFQRRSGFMRYLRTELSKHWREPWSEEDDGDLEMFDIALDEMVSEDIRFILCLDEVEHVAKHPDEFDDLLEDLRANGQIGQLGIMTASATSLADICQTNGVTSPFYNIFTQHRIGLLPKQDWVTLLSQNMHITDEDILLVDKLAGGHPFYIQMVAAQMWEMKRNNIGDYSKLTQVLKEQMKPHLQSLWNTLSEQEQLSLQKIFKSDRLEQDNGAISSLKERCIIQNGRVFSTMMDESVIAT